MKRSKQAQVKRKMELEGFITRKKKTRQKSKLSVSRGVLSQAEKQKQFRLLFSTLSSVQRSYILAELNSIVDTQRIAWIQASNLRDRLLRDTKG